ncbi:lytic transglycosylase domain-containing protein [Novosphingobium profundi]|nr:lytic transglycosylase domain-containing protein [Novosphingobium profundi]MBT0668775.1 lytic transglycosylase domain-containing protein [Novosphingobium profundi]
MAPARADVLEVGRKGAQWVAGGPATATGPFEPQPVGGSADVLAIGADGILDDAEMVGDVPVSVHQSSLTLAADTAGPARWRQRVAQLAAKYDISPALLEAVVWQESRWNERALSPAGARGLAQLMPGTARTMGVDPDDPQANLEGGARYLRQQLDAFGGDIEKALAAYNAGPRRVLQAGGIPNIRETQAYVAAIMARLSDPVRQ